MHGRVTFCGGQTRRFHACCDDVTVPSLRFGTRITSKKNEAIYRHRTPWMVWESDPQPSAGCLRIRHRSSALSGIDQALRNAEDLTAEHHRLLLCLGRCRRSTGRRREPRNRPCSDAVRKRASAGPAFLAQSFQVKGVFQRYRWWIYFPTCQVRVARFYVSSRPPPPPCPPPDLNRKCRMAVFPAGPQPLCKVPRCQG